MATRRPKGPEWHWHGCTRCHGLYYDTCEDGKNTVCVLCLGGAGLTWQREPRLPVECCRKHARLPTKEERSGYKLVGDCLWFICDKCKRFQAYDDPKTQKENR